MHRPSFRVLTHLVRRNIHLGCSSLRFQHHDGVAHTEDYTHEDDVVSDPRVPVARPRSLAASLGLADDSEHVEEYGTSVQNTMTSPIDSEDAQQHLSAVAEIVKSSTPGLSSEEIVTLLHGAKTAKEVGKVWEEHIYPHPLFHDILNGHGFRVEMLTRVTSICCRTRAINEWFQLVEVTRACGVQLTRTFIAEAFNLIKEWIKYRFRVDGRHPQIAISGIDKLRRLLRMIREDKMQLDYVLYGRCISLATHIVAVFDRQNVYRVTFSEELSKRDGLVSDWVIGHVRIQDYDEVVQLCDKFVEEEVLADLRRTLIRLPCFSLTYRLIDFYFSCDNAEKMLGVFEDLEAANAMGTIAESSIAKLMQVCIAFNIPEMPELLYKWRVSLPQCGFAAADMSRIMVYYCRSGGGLPCPHCGEKFNHRNVSIDVWNRTPADQKACPLLAMARRRKSELEDSPELNLPQTRDWSHIAFACLDASSERALNWGMMEWRSFLMCCTFCKDTAKAEKAMNAFLSGFGGDPRNISDDLLRLSFIRFLRYQFPERIPDIVEGWIQVKLSAGPESHVPKSGATRLSPLLIQELILASCHLTNLPSRVHLLEVMHRRCNAMSLFVNAYTFRYMYKKRVVPDPSTVDASYLQREADVMKKLTQSVSNLFINAAKENRLEHEPMEEALYRTMLEIHDDSQLDSPTGHPRSWFMAQSGKPLSHTRDGHTDIVNGTTYRHVFVPLPGNRARKAMK